MAATDSAECQSNDRDASTTAPRRMFEGTGQGTGAYPDRPTWRSLPRPTGSSAQAVSTDYRRGDCFALLQRGLRSSQCQRDFCRWERHPISDRRSDPTRPGPDTGIDQSEASSAAFVAIRLGSPRRPLFVLQRPRYLLRCLSTVSLRPSRRADARRQEQVLRSACRWLETDRPPAETSWPDGNYAPVMSPSMMETFDPASRRLMRMLRCSGALQDWRVSAIQVFGTGASTTEGRGRAFASDASGVP